MHGVPPWTSPEEIRCQFIILARKDEPTPDYRLWPASKSISKSEFGVSSSFLPEKTDRHRITRKDELTSDYARKDELTPDYTPEKTN